jgi:hypothetical protein
MERLADGAEKRARPGLDLFAVAFFFWATVLALRLVIFAASAFGTAPAITIHGVHIHHFVIGFALLAMLLLRSSSTAAPVLAGVGLGLVLDESLYWSRARYDYWSFWNFSAEATAGILCAAIAVRLQETRVPDSAIERPTAHQNPEHPFVSVIIPAYNEEQFLPKALGTYQGPDISKL